MINKLYKCDQTLESIQRKEYTNSTERVNFFLKMLKKQKQHFEKNISLKTLEKEEQEFIPIVNSMIPHKILKQQLINETKQNAIKQKEIKQKHQRSSKNQQFVILPQIIYQRLPSNQIKKQKKYHIKYAKNNFSLMLSDQADMRYLSSPHKRFHRYMRTEADQNNPIAELPKNKLTIESNLKSNRPVISGWNNIPTRHNWEFTIHDILDKIQ